MLFFAVFFLSLAAKDTSENLPNKWHDLTLWLKLYKIYNVFIQP
jgi:hypothetical protein